MKQLCKEDYTVGWICALPVPEWKASRTLLDEVHKDLPLGAAAKLQYVYGTMNAHNVVMGCLPDSQTGVGAAAAVASEMGSTFTRMRFGLLVGVGGGMPSEASDIRLGDIVVCRPDTKAGHGGVIQYDIGKALQGGVFEPTGMLNQPPELLLSALGKVHAAPRAQSALPKYLEVFTQEEEDDIDFSKRPLEDKLFEAHYAHEEEETCRTCDPAAEVKRTKRKSKLPRVHYGTIACGNQVMKDAAKRDEISKRCKGILCFEMKAAGLMNRFECLVIRGICDYCDSHKNKEWQPYDAAAAAAWAKWLLKDVSLEPEAAQVIGGAQIYNAVSEGMYS
ncbi:hypothetical protein LTR08_004177 [Meristemomyces frigidus]|nr:hypothetical protein LTR08_004177 [Meristemomyces frigidus]